MTKTVWEEIDSFVLPSEFERFVQYIEGQVKAGYAKEIDPYRDYAPGELYGSRWFEDVDSGEVWRLVPPDFPFKGTWEPVQKDDGCRMNFPL